MQLLAKPVNSRLDGTLAQIQARPDLGWRPLDNAGKLDLVIGNDLDHSIWIQRNVGAEAGLTAATFAPPIKLSVPARGSNDPYKITVADLDGDGLLDLITCAISGSQVLILQNLTTPELGISFSDPVNLNAGADCRFPLIIGALP